MNQSFSVEPLYDIQTIFNFLHLHLGKDPDGKVERLQMRLNLDLDLVELAFKIHAP